MTDRETHRARGRAGRWPAATFRARPNVSRVRSEVSPSKATADLTPNRPGSPGRHDGIAVASTWKGRSALSDGLFALSLILQAGLHGRQAARRIWPWGLARMRSGACAG